MCLHSTCARLVAAVLLLASVTSAKAETVKLSFSFFADAKEATYVTTFKPWLDEINANGKGVLEIVPYLNGSLGRGPGVQAQNVLDGVADISFIITSFTPGRFPEVDVLTLPGLFRGFRDAAVIPNQIVMSGVFHDVDAFHLIWSSGNTPYTVHMRGPAKTLEDLKGHKIRVAGAYMAEAMKALGAVPVFVPVTEAAEALGRGTVDGALTPMGTMRDYGMDRVTRYDYLLPISSGGFLFAMSGKRWDALSEPARALLSKYGNSWLQARYLKGYGAHDQAELNHALHDPNRVVTVPTEEEIRIAQAAYKPIYESFAAKSPRNAELLKIVQSRIAQYWRDNPPTASK
jgi:TRAP-type C4-dicarboxylate transport system substrate-binding protein